MQSAIRVDIPLDAKYFAKVTVVDDSGEVEYKIQPGQSQSFWVNQSQAVNVVMVAKE